MKIPKILHQTHSNINQDVIRSRDSFMALHPDWEYKFWDDNDCEELIKENYSDFYLYWKNFKKPIKKWDAVRSIFLHKFGGVYADTDVIFYKNIEKIILANYKLVFRSPIRINKNFDVIKNHFMASCPKLNFWRNHLQFIKSFKLERDQLKPDNRTDLEMNVTSHTGELSLAKCLRKELKSNSLTEDDILIIDPSHVINHNFTNSLKPKDFRQSEVYAEHFANNSWNS